MEVTPGIFMKTKEGKNQVSGKTRSPRSGVRCLKLQAVSTKHSVSRLLSPASCLSKNEGASGDIHENKGTGKTGVRDHVSRIRCQVSEDTVPRAASREKRWPIQISKLKMQHRDRK